MASDRPAKELYLKAVFASRSHAKACPSCLAADGRQDPRGCCAEGIRLLRVSISLRKASDAETTALEAG